jgi:hypothetical protein
MMNRTAALEARAVGRTFYPGVPTSRVGFMSIGSGPEIVIALGVIFGPIAYGIYLAVTGSLWTGVAIAAGWTFIGLPLLAFALYGREVPT